VNLVLDSAIEPGSLEDLVPDGVVSLAVTAHEVDDDLDVDSSCTFANDPAGEATIDGD